MMSYIHVTFKVYFNIPWWLLQLTDDIEQYYTSIFGAMPATNVIQYYVIVGQVWQQLALSNT